EFNQSSRILGLKRKALDQINLLLNSGLASSKRLRKDDDSVENFRIRLATFHAGKWQNGKELNPRRLAERGWKLVDASKKTIKCDSCGFYLNTTLPDITTVDIKVYNRCLRKVYESLDTCHEKTCTARSRRPNFFPHLNDKSELKSELYAQLDKIKDVEMHRHTAVNEEMLDTAAILKIFPDESIDQRLKTLVLTGWEKKDSSNVHCSLCLRTMSLDVSFIPSGSHYSWCPYLDLHNHPLDIPQWKVIINTVSHTTSSLDESLSISRRLLNSSLLRS
ncbi:hypothetical protein PMAYCL1PPCAC_18157, partial [Pristionchus mayeri]